MSHDVTAVLLDQLTLGIALITPGCRPMHTNSAFRQLVHANPEIQFNKNLLSIASIEDNRTLRVAAQRPVGSERAIIGLSRESGRQGLDLALVTLSEDVVAVFASDSLADTARVSSALKSAYGLTQGQSEITELVVRGFDTNQIAEQRTVHVSTVRTLLKRTFQKTGVSRQVDLVRLALGGVAARVRATRETPSSKGSNGTRPRC